MCSSLQCADDWISFAVWLNPDSSSTIEHKGLKMSSDPCYFLMIALEGKEKSGEDSQAIQLGMFWLAGKDADPKSQLKGGRKTNYLYSPFLLREVFVLTHRALRWVKNVRWESRFNWTEILRSGVTGGCCRATISLKLSTKVTSTQIHFSFKMAFQNKNEIQPFELTSKRISHDHSPHVHAGVFAVCCLVAEDTMNIKKHW